MLKVRTDWVRVASRIALHWSRHSRGQFSEIKGCFFRLLISIFVVVDGEFWSFD